MIFYIEERI